jgi:hypothetical protein
VVAPLEDFSAHLKVKAHVVPDDLSRVQDRQSHLRSARARVQLVAPLELERLEMEEFLYKDHFASWSLGLRKTSCI